MSREYPERPLLGVGALIFNEDKVLLVKRGRNPGKGQWSIPGGMVEIGETLADAVTREVLEETGLQVRPVRLVKTLERIFRDDNGRVQYHYVLCDFLCEIIGGDPCAASDADDVTFIALRELVAYGVAPITREVITEAYNNNMEHVYHFASSQ